MSATRRRRPRVPAWQPDGGLLACSRCGAPSVPASPPPWPVSPCCAAPAAPGPQRRILVSLADVYEVLVAGEIGAGKTDPTLMAMVAYQEYRTNAAFKGLVLRHSAVGGDSAKDALSDLYQRVERPGYWKSYVGGRLNRTKGVYTFRSGGSVLFSTTRAIRSLQGPEFQCLLVNELTHWRTADDYLYVASTRMRSAAGLPIKVRADTNAGGPGMEWVKARWGPWLAGDYFAMDKDRRPRYPASESLRALGYGPRYSDGGKPLPPVESGAVLHYLLDERGRYEWCRPGTPGALTRSCLRLRTEDNWAMMRSDPAYAMRVRGVGGSRQGGLLLSQLTEDDWDAQGAEGDMFKRTWFPVVDAQQVPRLDGVMRRWDLAYTAPDSAAARKKRDWTVGDKVGWVGPPEDRRWYLLHSVRTQGTPAEIRALIQQTAALDGPHCLVVVPVDYAAGQWVAHDIRAALPGCEVRPVKERGAKDVRIRALAAQVAPPGPGLPPAGRVVLVHGPWVEAFLDEASAYPDGRWDDQLDCLAGAVIDSAELGAAATPREQERDLEIARGLSRGLEQMWDAPMRAL